MQLLRSLWTLTTCLCRQYEARLLRPRRPPLLQQLLAQDIRQEHSHLLQAFRFIVNNDFLQDVNKPLVFRSTENSPLDVQAGGENCHRGRLCAPLEVCKSKQADVLADLREALSESSSSSGEELGEGSEGATEKPAFLNEDQL